MSLPALGVARDLRRGANRGVSIALMSFCWGLACRDTMFEIDAIARRYSQKVGGPPDDIIFKLADLAVGIHKLPHHFDDAQSAFLVDRAQDNAGKMIKIYRLALDQHR